MKIKSFLFTILCCVVLALGACQRSNLFEPKSETSLNNPIFGPSGEVAIALEIIGNPPGAYRALLIESNGFMRYEDSLGFAGQVTSALWQEEYGNLVALFLEKDFLHLEDHYESTFRPGAARMRVLFKHGGTQKTVTTDSVSAPTGLQQILARLSQHMQSVRNNLLLLAFTSDRDTLVHGEEAHFILKVTNPHARAVSLLSHEPVVDFFAFMPYDAATPEKFYEPPYVWQTAPSSTSVKVVQATELAAGESLTFQTAWGGRDRYGNLLEGTFWVAARFAAIPGGYSAPLAIHVRKK